MFELELRKFNKNVRTSSQVHGIPNAEKNSKQIYAWIKRVEELHKKNPPVSRDTNSALSKKFPDIEQLMQEWNPEFESILSNVFSLPFSLTKIS